MFENTYKTIDNSCEGLFKDKGSKFIAKAYPVKTETEVKNIIQSLKKDYYDARHHCYAYILGYDKSAFRINDDGEPSGTAGRPIYGQLQHFDLTNTLIVVIRYFGGTLLGVSGLINAYKNASIEAINNATIIEKFVKEHYNIHFQYLQMNEVMKIIKDDNIEILNQNFDNECEMDLIIKKSESVRIYEKLKKIENLTIDFKGLI